MLNLVPMTVFFSLTVPLIILLLVTTLKTLFKTSSSSSSSELSKSYPVIGHFFSIVKNRNRLIQWTSDIVTANPSLTIIVKRNFAVMTVITADPTVVEHVLKSSFRNYDKGDLFRTNLRDLLGDGIFNADGDSWKFQRQVASHEFNTRSLRRFVETAVDSEIAGRLIPILTTAAAEGTVLDLQDILQRFAFDNVCKIAFGYDPEYLSPSLPKQDFAVAFETAVRLSTKRFQTFIPYSWKVKKALDIGSEKELRIAVEHIRELATKIVREKKHEIQNHSLSSCPDDDLLSRFLRSGHLDEALVRDIVISFILAGRDTTSAALTWFFWLLSGHRSVEEEILREISKEKSASAYEEVKEMVYTHASLCESMRLYPPVPFDTKAVLHDDVLPGGMPVKKGTRVSYHPYAMGRVEKVWGKDWAKFRPERWLQSDGDKLNFVNRDAYTYPVFQAGPRICLGKDMAFIQMKRVVAAVLKMFRVVPVVVDGVEPVLEVALTAKMKGGFPVRMEARGKDRINN